MEELWFYIKTGIEAVVERDIKGLYAKAISGEIPNFTGISDPFEDPESPALVIETDKEEEKESLERLYNFIISQV